MDEPIVSQYSTFFYAQAAAAIVLAIGLPTGLIYNSITNAETGNQLIVTVVFCVATIAISVYHLFKITNQITITRDKLLVKYLVGGKQLSINYDDIENVGTYRKRSNESRFGAINYQSFVIELKNGKTISLSEGNYDNYDEMKAAIYKYKLGVGA